MPLSSLSPSCWPLSRKDIASKSVKIFVHMRWWHILYVEGHQRGLELSLQKWLRDEKAVITMEGHFITPTGEGAVKLKFNSMLIVYFWHHRFVHREFNPPPTINWGFYSDSMKHLREDIRQKWWDRWSVKNTILHKSNGHCHQDLLTHQKQSSTASATAPFARFISPVCFHRFPEMKQRLKGCGFNTVVVNQIESRWVPYFKYILLHINCRVMCILIKRIAIEIIKLVYPAMMFCVSTIGHSDGNPSLWFFCHLPKPSS